MKIIDIALKDLVRSFRSAFALVFMFAVPLLTTALFYFAFGGLSGDGGFNLPTTQVRVANLDEPAAGVGDFSAGRLLVGLLRSEGLSDLIEVTEVESADQARAAVDRQEVGVAIIIPPDLSTALQDPQAGARASIELYQDPTLTLGPRIVQGIISRFVDGFAGARIAVGVVQEQLSARDVALEPAAQQQIAMAYTNWVSTLGEGQAGNAPALVQIQRLGGGETEEGGEIVRILSLIMTGMMIFYAFFTGAASAESLLREDEEGTLPRLFTTPTPQSTILGGKFIAIFVTLVVQIIVLVIVAALVFGVDWGRPLPLLLAALGLIALAGSFGLFITSFLKNTRQGGIVYGGVMTVAGMVGISSIFTAGLEGGGGTTQLISLLVPQGWAMRGWRHVLDGQGVEAVLPTVVVMLALAVVFFAIGVYRFNKRFA